MDSKWNNTTKNKSKKEQLGYGCKPGVDPVSAQRKRDNPKKKKKMKKESFFDTTLNPTMSTRIGLEVREPGVVGAKYVVPLTKKYRKMADEKKRKLEEDRKFCKYKITKMPSPKDTRGRVKIKYEAPSAEIKEAKVIPRKASVTPSQTYPEPPEDVGDHKPKSGTIINIQKKKRVIKKKKVRPPRERTIEELMAEELATIQEMGEDGEDEMLDLPPENYLTKQFRKRVAQMSRTTSIHSKDYQEVHEVGSEEGEEEEERELPDEEKDRFIDVLVQKFRRDSEIKRYEPPKRKIKKGTFENFSFTKLKQPTLKTFYYGVKMATIHQGDLHFPDVSRDRQGICMPIAAYCLSIIKHPDKWTQGDIDDVLEAGNELFLESAGNQHMHGDDIELKISDLQKYCKIGTKKIRFVVSEPEVSGLVRSEDKKIYNLTKAINVFFGRYTSGILQTDNFNVALWKDKHYYFFDASPRTLDLFASPYGVALMANFYDITSIVTVLLNRSDLENTPFVIYSIKAYRVLGRDAEEVDSTGLIPETDNYQVLDEERAVAQGSFDLADKCFGFSRNKQALTIAAVALVYSKITPPSSWHRGTVDKIVIIGNQLFLECIESDDIEEIKIQDLPAIFTIGPYVVEIYVSANRFTDFMFKKGKCMLAERLEKFFETNSNAIVQIDNCTIAIWKQRNMYHCFDPYSRNGEGLKCRDGSACISMHTTLPSLMKTVATNFDHKDMIFHVHALKVCKINRDSDRSNLFPRDQTMNDFPIENFKKIKMRRGKRKATVKPVTVDRDTRAVTTEALDGSILQVGSNVKSIGMEYLPPMCQKSPSKIIMQMAPLDKDFVADLDSPSLSDTQIEPDLPEDEGELEVEFQDLDDFSLTKEEEELEQRGEGAEGAEGQESSATGQCRASKKSAEEELEEEMLREGGAQEYGEDDWYMAASDFTQVGSQSLMSRVSAEVNTDFFNLEIPEEEVPTITRNIRAMAQRHKKMTEEEDKYECEMLPELVGDPLEDYTKESNFMQCPDGTQIVLGTKNMAGYSDDVELMAPFVGIMAAAVAKKYAIDSWSKEIVDYVLKCGAELHQNANTRYDQNYKLEIAKISLGSTDFSIRVDYVFDTYIKPRVLAMAIGKMLFPKCPSGILVTPTYSCALFYKRGLYYLYDGFGNNEVGLSKGPNNEGVACFARFRSLDELVARVIHNKSKREKEENIEYNRFVLSSCYIKKLPKEVVDEPEAEEKEDEEPYPNEAEDGAPPERQESVRYQSYKKKKDEKEEKKKPPPMGYRRVKNMYKIQGTKMIGGERSVSDQLKEDYFACICACLLLLNTPLKKWDEKKIDYVLDEGVNIFNHAEDIDVCSKKFIKNVLIEDYLFDIIADKVKFTTFQQKRTLKNGIETMMSKKHKHFILQFPNRSYTISVQDDTYHLFDPSDKEGKASWTKYTNFKKLVRRLRSGLVKGAESYNFHSFEIMSISNAPKHIVVSNRAKKYKVVKRDKKLEKFGKPFNEECCWLEVDPVPWSMKTDKEDKPLWNNWFEEYKDDLYSLFGTLSPMDVMFPQETRGKQTLGNLIACFGMTQIYELKDWNAAVLDSILLFGNIFFYECIKDITDENYEVAFDDIKKECKIFPYSFKVKFTPVVEGTMFLIRLKQFNLYKALRLFFDDYDKRFGVICLTKNDQDKRLYAFGKTQDCEYFLYDCETLGPPMYMEKNSGFPYVLRCTTLNRLLHAMTLTLRGGDFYIFDVGLSQLKAVIDEENK